MPSTILGQPLASGPQQLVSGYPWSGTGKPIGGIQLKLDLNASGRCYIGLSGNMTMLSGGLQLSGSLGINDGMQLGPGDSYFIPKSALVLTSGAVNIYIWADVACSGQSRLYYEVGF